MKIIEQLSDIALSALLDSPKNSASLTDAVSNHVLFNSLLKQVFELLLQKGFVESPTSNIDLNKLNVVLTESGKKFILSGGFQ